MNKKTRRTFFKKIIKGGVVLTAYPWMANFQSFLADLDEEQDEKRYWKKIRKQYTPSTKLINLNNAGVNPQPVVVQEAVSYYEKLSNELPSFYMWRVIDKEKDLVKEGLANLIGCQKEDLAIQRNTTEALETVIFGLSLERGDEVVLGKYDYPHMIFAWKQRAERDGIVLKWVDLKLPSHDPDYLLEQYKKQISDKTKLVCITHVINWNGQVLPLKKIASYARSKGAEVLVDAAHTIGQRPIQVDKLDIDYLATSLHKWLGGPFGTGLLYVKKGKRKALYPTFAGPNPRAKGMHKFEHLGTRASSHERAILPAILFYKSIGVHKKMDRLQYLKMYIVDNIKHLPRVNILSPIDLENGSAILLFSIDGCENKELVRTLEKKWDIHCTIAESENLSGVRISPNVFTQLSELNTFVEAIHTLAKSK